MIYRSDVKKTLWQLQSETEFWYFSEKILKLASNVGREHIVSLGSCFGKFNQGGKFRLHVTALDYLAPYAKVLEKLYNLCVMLMKTLMNCIRAVNQHVTFNTSLKYGLNLMQSSSSCMEIIL